eukprot:Rmarinus@m.16818
MDRLQCESSKEVAKHMSLYGDSEVIFSCAVEKINTSGKRQKRALCITNGSIYNMRQKDFQMVRRLAIESISSIISSESSEQFLVKVNFDNDLLLASHSFKESIIDAITATYCAKTGYTLSVQFQPDKSLLDLVRSKKPKDKRYVEKLAKYGKSRAMSGVSRPGLGQATPDSYLADFAAPDFDPSQYARSFFAQLKTDRVVEKCKDLDDVKTLAAEALKDSVYANYPMFIRISKDIGEIETDLISLRSLLSDERDIVKGLQHTGLPFSSLHGKKSRRKSALDPDEMDTDGFAVDKLSGHDNADPGGVNDRDVVPLQESALVEELDELLAERNLQKAVSLLERAYEQSSNDELGSDVEERLEKAVSMMCEELLKPMVKKSDWRRNIEFLMRLRREEKARAMFFQSRSARIAADIRNVKSHGDILSFVRELGSVVFSTIGAACVEFRYLFHKRNLMSGFVAWAVNEINELASICRRRVFSSRSLVTIVDVIEIISRHSREYAEREKGFSLTFYVEGIFRDDFCEGVHGSLDRVLRQVVSSVDTERWVGRDATMAVPSLPGKTPSASTSPDGSARGSVQSGDVPDSLRDGDEDNKAGKSAADAAKVSLRVTSSCKVVYNLLHRATSDLTYCLHITRVVNVSSPKLYAVVTDGIARVLVEYMRQLLKAIDSGNLTVPQLICVAQNGMHVVTDLMPRVRSVVQDNVLRRPVDEFVKMDHGLRRQYAQLVSKLGVAASQILINELGESMPEAGFGKLIHDIAGVHGSIEEALGSSAMVTAMDSLVSSVLQHCTVQIEAGLFFAADATKDKATLRANVEFFLSSIYPYLLPIEKAGRNKGMDPITVFVNAAESHTGPLRIDTKPLEQH